MNQSIITAGQEPASMVKYPDDFKITIYFYTLQPRESVVNKALTLLTPSKPELFTAEFAHWQGIVKELSEALLFKDSPFNIATEALPRPLSPGLSQPQIIVLLLSSKDLVANQYSPDSQKKLPEIIRYFRNTCSSDLGDEVLGDAFNYQPMITIGLEDFMNLYSEDENPDGFFRQLNLDHRIKYLDSSIWNRYVPVEIEGTSVNFVERFKNISNHMAQWHLDGIYNTVAAVTTLEFQTRMLYNSFIAKVNEKGHNELVRPFKFHSETQMQRKGNELMKFFKDDRNDGSFIGALKWNFLLVDDQANQVPISSIKQEEPPSNVHEGKDEKKPLLTKAVLIQKILDMDFPYGSITMDCPKQAENIVDEMIEKLEPKNTMVFDVILLDYLLGLGKDREREYGHDFLLKLRQKPALQKGPYNRFWIFPISSFPHAFTDKLHQMGINHLTDWWHLSNGGDPICAPELFRYNLLEFLRQQINVCYYDELMMAKMIQKFQGIQNYYDWIESTSRVVRHMQGFRDQLRRKKGSAFCSSFITFLDGQEYMLRLETKFLSFLELLGGWGSNETIMKGIKEFRSQQESIGKTLPPLEELLLTRDKKFKIYILDSGSNDDGYYLNKVKTHIKSSSRKLDIEVKSAEDIRAGDSIPEMIDEMIMMANLFLVLISVDLLAFDQKAEELDKILLTKKRIIPINCRNCIVDDRLITIKALPDNGKFLIESSNLERDMSVIISFIIQEIEHQWPRK